MKSLGTLPGFLGSFASKINEAGQVVGKVTTDKESGLPRAFLWQNGKMTDLGALPGDKHSSADAINNRGQIIGVSGTASQAPHGNKVVVCIWQNGTPTKIPIDLNEPYVVDMNDAGDVLGASMKEDQLNAFVYRNGKIVELGTLGGKYSEPNAINAKGEIVGNAETDRHEYHAFLYREGKMLDLRTLGGSKSEAHGINRSGQIVGRSAIRPGDEDTMHAFLYGNGQMIDLNRLIPARSKWALTSANAINDKGQILCHGEADGKLHAILLTPR